LASNPSGTHNLSALRTRPTTAPEAVDFILLQALRLKASDIHLGLNNIPAAGALPGQLPDPYVLRFRVHGKLQTVRCDWLTPFYKEVIARFKVLAGISTTETQIPQDGQIHVSAPDGTVVLRLATVPSGDQEDVVLRVQRGYEKYPALTELGMTRTMLARLEHLIRQKSGLIILNGPAGSGKTSTIYSILSTIASPERKIVTAEDPIETRLPWVSHLQVTPKTGFASLSRAFMRQDAEVIFIGEVRDNDSASAAVQLAQTGHLVLTTLHTRDSVGVISRLEAFDIHPNFIATSLIGSLAQRLVPRLCAHCKTEYQPDRAMVKAAMSVAPPAQAVRFYKPGPGCPQCAGGIAGRLPIFELFTVDAPAADMINRRCPRAELLIAAHERGMTTLAEEALIRVYAGYIDIASVYSYLAGPDAAELPAAKPAPAKAAG
jgi:type II secretory ATPase GspE/PulE/Tfp pilus assembly ATPase PilB-like protein